MELPRENYPDSLLRICLEYLVQHPETLCSTDVKTGYLSLREGVSLPAEICEQIIRVATDTRSSCDDAFFHIFRDTVRTHLKRIIIRNAHLSDIGFGWLMRHKPIEVDISQCTSLSRACFQHISEHGHRLQALFIGNLGTKVAKEEDEEDEDEEVEEVEERDGWSSPLEGAGDGGQTVLAKRRGVYFNCPQLRAFSMRLPRWTADAGGELLSEILRPFKHLAYLDLSNTPTRVEDMHSLESVPSLVTLILYGVPVVDIHAAFTNIMKLRYLRTLDLGQDRDNPVEYQDPDENLARLVSALSHLSRLDLSGTNLAGFEAPDRLSSRPPPQKQHWSEEGDFQEEDGEEGRTRGGGGGGGGRCSIPGLRGRHLDFLGLLHCAHDPCARQNIPAKQVTGNASEEQVLLSIQTYVERPYMLVQSLDHLFQIFRYSTCTDQRRALQAILTAMKRHPSDKHIQISGSASLFYIVKGEEKEYLSYRTKRRTIEAILDGMENHPEETTMMRNGCLTLCHFKIPQDVLFQYQRMVSVLLKMVGRQEQEEFVQRIGIYLLNSLSCQVDGRDKQLVGDLGAINTMLGIIQRKLQQEVCDEVMEIAWSTMWNVTDETAVNCERFIREGGMELFLQCLEQFPGKPELLRNMMGLMGNVAEVAYLRPKLCQKQYVLLFSELLDSESDGIEVSYNACGVLAHMVSDGEDMWLLRDPPRKDILGRMVQAIQRWNIKTKRNINYRSFEPILRLLHKYDTPECQHWAIWALCNLTTMYPHKYCPLLKKENGIALIKEVLQDGRPNAEIVALAQQVVVLCGRYDTDPDFLETGSDVDPGSDQEMMDG